jgi:S-adenosylmethionine hydrolase
MTGLPMITLLTDFGTADGFVAAMKGVIATRAPGAVIVDATHDIPPQDVRAGAFALLGYVSHFPAGTIHVAVVDPGVGSARRAIAVEAGGRWFVGPDNGIFTGVYDREAGWRAWQLTEPRFFEHPVSATFHGRDVFAPVAAAIATGVEPAELGPRIDDPVRLAWAAVRHEGGRIRGEVIHVDRFGNLVTNVSRAEAGAEGFPPGAMITVAGRRIGGLLSTFAEAADGSPFALWGSAGLLEIAVAGGSAAMALAAGRGSEVTIEIPSR